MRRVEVYQGLVTFDIPVDWNEIPGDVLEFHTLQSVEATGGRLAETYQHGFRPGDPENDFELPQILIQIRESGRLKYGQFLHLPTVESLQRQDDATLEDRAGPVLGDAHLNEVSFNREGFFLRVHNTLRYKGVGKALVVSASFLTERGLFTVHCYAHISQNIVAAPIFEQIIASVRIDESIRYQPRFSDRLPPASALIAYAIAAILAVATVITLLVRRRLRAS